jgi:hypothetical protein
MEVLAVLAFKYRILHGSEDQTSFSPPFELKTDCLSRLLSQLELYHGSRLRIMSSIVIGNLLWISVQPLIRLQVSFFNLPLRSFSR